MSEKENTSSRFSLSVFALLLAGGIFFVGYQTGSTSTPTMPPGVPLGASSELESADFSPFWKVWQALEEKYVAATTSKNVSLEDKIYGATQGLAASYGDPYTSFLPPRENELFETSINGSFSGVGMEVGMRGNALTVIAPLKGTPADNAGMQPGDIILKIDDTLTQGMNVDEAVELIRGEKGTSVTLTIIREGRNEPLEVTIVRDTINIPTISHELQDNGIYLIQLYNFSAPAALEFRNALRTFLQSDSNQLVLDLRGNPGGFLDASVEMASYFLPAGKIIVTEDYGENKEDKVHRSKGYNIFDDNLEMVVLINQGSASASEILAGALSEHGVATLVGETTFGKGSVQELVQITDKTALKVTVARWLTPNGTSISDGGLTPDIEVERTIEDLEAGVDPQLERAMEVLLEN